MQLRIQPKLRFLNVPVFSVQTYRALLLLCSYFLLRLPFPVDNFLTCFLFQIRTHLTSKSRAELDFPVTMHSVLSTCAWNPQIFQGNLTNKHFKGQYLPQTPMLTGLPAGRLSSFFSTCFSQAFYELTVFVYFYTVYMSLCIICVQFWYSLFL